MLSIDSVVIVTVSLTSPIVTLELVMSNVALPLATPSTKNVFTVTFVGVNAVPCALPKLWSENLIVSSPV